jgi:hypothetical protein
MDNPSPLVSPALARCHVPVDPDQRMGRQRQRPGNASEGRFEIRAQPMVGPNSGHFPVRHLENRNFDFTDIELAKAYSSLRSTNFLRRRGSCCLHLDLKSNSRAHLAASLIRPLPPHFLQGAG